MADCGAWRTRQRAESVFWTRRRWFSAPWRRVPPPWPNWFPRQVWHARPPTVLRWPSSITAWSPETCRDASFWARASKSSPLRQARIVFLLLLCPCSRRCATTRRSLRSSSAVRATTGCASPGLRDSIPVGATLSMAAGSAAQVLLAWEEPDRLHRGLYGASFNATMLSQVRRRGWAQSVGEREPGVASVSAPVRGPSGRVLAALSISGPIERMGRQPGRQHGPSVVAAANRLSDFLRSVEDSDL